MSIRLQRVRSWLLSLLGWGGCSQRGWELVVCAGPGTRHRGELLLPPRRRQEGWGLCPPTHGIDRTQHDVTGRNTSCEPGVAAGFVKGEARSIWSQQPPTPPTPRGSTCSQLRVLASSFLPGTQPQGLCSCSARWALSLPPRTVPGRAPMSPSPSSLPIPSLAPGSWSPLYSRIFIP